MNYDYPTNERMSTIIKRLMVEDDLPGSYLYTTTAAKRTLKYLVELGFVKATPIPHANLTLHSITDKGRELNELLNQIESMFPPMETTTTSEELEDDTVINDADSDDSEARQTITSEDEDDNAGQSGDITSY